MSQPIFFLAFSHDPTNTLAEISNEIKSIEGIFNATGIAPNVTWRVTQDDMERQFDINRDGLRIFHFGGHAGKSALQVNDGQGNPKYSFAAGLAGLAAQAQGLRLVFLNGCSTEEQAQAFIDKGIPAVIATTKPLVDRYALEFARRFYQSFTRANSKMTLRQAFDAAFLSFIGEHGSLTREMIDERVRGAIDIDEDGNEPLYELHINPAKKFVEQERFADWMNLKSGPDYTALRKELQTMIAQARLEDALEKLAEVNPDAVQLLATYRQVKREKTLGLLDTDDWFKHQARSTHSALELIKGLG